jgi:hypothetical protein
MASYYRRFVAQVCRQVLAFGREQAVSLIIAFLILLYQFHYGQMTASAMHADTMAVIWPYVWVLGGYFLIQVLRAPVALDHERAKQTG